MTCSHREETRNGRIIDWLENSQAGLRIGISRLGAELISVQRRSGSGEWIGFLHRDNDLTPPKSGWANHSTVMGYFLHRLKDERSLYRGHEIRGGTHGFLRHKTWKVAAVSGERINYRITPDDFSPVEYPLNVSLDLSYAVLDDQIAVEFYFRNHEPRLSAHVGFGIHPGFAAQSFESFEFKMPAGVYRRCLSPGNFLSDETEEVIFTSPRAPYQRAKLPGSYIFELRFLESSEFVFEDLPSGRLVRVNLGDAPYLTLWSDGGPFLCVEPCWGLTDHQEQRAFEDKLGIQVIPAGGELLAQCAIMPQLIQS
jgi:galactose mutarotase-like enzyme